MAFIYMVLAQLYAGAYVLLTTGLIRNVCLRIFILHARIGAFGFICGTRDQFLSWLV
jgi:hypothetical protein